jgi:hypothetical protein
MPLEANYLNCRMRASGKPFAPSSPSSMVLTRRFFQSAGCHPSRRPVDRDVISSPKVRTRTATERPSATPDFSWMHVGSLITTVQGSLCRNCRIAFD